MAEWAKQDLQLNDSVKSLNFSMRCRLYPPTSLFMACKEKHNLRMNHASLYCEWLDRVWRTCTTF